MSNLHMLANCPCSSLALMIRCVLDSPQYSSIFVRMPYGTSVKFSLGDFM